MTTTVTPAHFVIRTHEGKQEIRLNGYLLPSVVSACIQNHQGEPTELSILFETASVDYVQGPFTPTPDAKPA